MVGKLCLFFTKALAATFLMRRPMNFDWERPWFNSSMGYALSVIRPLFASVEPGRENKTNLEQTRVSGFFFSAITTTLFIFLLLSRLHLSRRKKSNFRAEVDASLLDALGITIRR